MEVILPPPGPQSIVAGKPSCPRTQFCGPHTWGKEGGMSSATPEIAYGTQGTKRTMREPSSLSVANEES